MNQRNDDIKYMKRCIQLARNGRQNAKPNPMVGAVIVHDGKIIGEGYHVRCGESHAEVNAIASVRSEHLPLLPLSTIYVSLEPCSHYGKTPPCADLLIEKMIRRVVVGCQDPFAKVQGRGIQKLRDAGIEVEVGVCEDECKELNRVFFTFHRFHRPFVTLKWAETSDGNIGRRMADGHCMPIQISGEFTQMLCHKLRAEHDAILVGCNTVVSDNPSLTTRHWIGPNPLRVVLSHRDVNHEGSNVFNDEAETIIVEGTIEEILSRLYERGIQSLLVEGGRTVLQQFIDSELWDEARIEQSDSPALPPLGEGEEWVKAPQISVGDDKMKVRSERFFDSKIRIITKL